MLVYLFFKGRVLLEKIHHYIRLYYDPGLFSSNKYQAFIQQLNKIGRMTGRWLKKL